jgi:DHA1 family tetracycline resistance protein-like MFS transporter
MSKPKNPIIFIFCTILIDCIGLGIIIPTLPALIQELTGENVSAAASYGGWMNFSYAMMSFLFAPILGGLSDKFGRRPVLLFSLFGLGIDYIFLALAPRIAWLIVGRIIAGICGASFTTASAYIADVSDENNRAKNFGMIGAAFGVGFIIGPLLGSIFGTLGTRAPFVAASILTLVNFLFGYFVLPESLSPGNRRAFNWKRANPIGSLNQLSKHKNSLKLILVLFILNLAGQAMPSIWTFFCVERFNWTQAYIGLSLAFVGVMVSIVQGGLIGFITKKIGVKRSIFIGLLCYMLGFFLFSLANAGWMMFAFMIPYALGGIAVPNIQSVLSSQVSPSEQGELQGGLTSLVSITAFIGPLLMTGSFTYFTKAPEVLYFPGISFLIGALLTLSAVILSYSTLRKDETELKFHFTKS